MKTKTLRGKISIYGVIGSVLLLNLIGSSCEQDNVDLDKKIHFTILDDHFGWGSGYETTIYSSSLINFNKSDYLKIESIFFIISDLKTSSIVDGSDINRLISVELFDLTNNVSIQGSKITTDDVLRSESKSSENLINYLPDSPINLGIRIINNDVDNCSWELHAASLILVRK